jgi:hypothetical protein
MQELYEQLSQISNQNENKRLTAQREYQNEQDNILRELIEKLSKDIMEDHVQKMTTASEDGYKHCVLYSFGQNDMYEEKHKKTFLSRGPINDRGFGKGLKFYHNKNIKPLIELLRDNLSPFRVEMRYNKQKRIHSIVVYWA